LIGEKKSGSGGNRNKGSVVLQTVQPNQIDEKLEKGRGPDSCGQVNGGSKKWRYARQLKASAITGVKGPQDRYFKGGGLERARTAQGQGEATECLIGLTFPGLRY